MQERPANIPERLWRFVRDIIRHTEVKYAAHPEAMRNIVATMLEWYAFYAETRFNFEYAMATTHRKRRIRKKYANLITRRVQMRVA
jgi:hypothetical protein